MDISLILFKKDGTKRNFPIRNKATTLGRGVECDLCIPLQVVSRKHCQLSLEPNALKIRDLKSSNGTYVNGTKIDGEATAMPGDRIQIGPLIFTLQVDGQPADITAPDDALIKLTPDTATADPEEMNRSATFTG
ncbi:MAG: FHA domain-containing protein [Sedimentisphaerales bacterium]|jgi:pSer/pThr/pTyr-binding forkhead associated (FHA) protein